jgi:ABC-type histidine transport system ATPase subunit
MMAMLTFPRPVQGVETQQAVRAPLLAVAGLHKSFGENLVLNGVSLEARTGDVISLIGSSGSGKSTLLRCINFLETPDAGTITFNGEAFDANVLRKRPKLVDHLRRQLGMVFQQFNLWSHMTILQNVTEAPIHVLKRDRREVHDEAMALLDRVGIADKKDAYPSEVSGGQQQRAAIARALCLRPRALLFDEPTSSLDPELVGEVLAIMRDLAEEGRTMIVVTHEMSFAREVSDRVLFLHRGVVEEEGTAAEVFDNPRSERCAKFLNEYKSRR